MKKRLFTVSALLVSLSMLFFGISSVSAKNEGAEKSQGKWWDVEPEVEISSPNYDSILYSEIAPRLREIEMTSNRVMVDIIGQSAGGRNLFLVTISKPGISGRFGHFKSLRKMMINDPEKALKKIDQYKDFKVPVFINGSIHGNEYPGTDACMRLIETMAYENTPEVLNILDNMILLINVVQNPDGRVLGTRQNAKGVDLNRDFITQTQPETRATAQLITQWNPMVFLDLHDDWQPMLIEPCSPPHNPNYEYDLYIQWALYQAYAMEAELVANTDETQAVIPFRDWNFADVGWSWDDWPPIYTPMYAMYHGAYGHTLETPYEDERGVDAVYYAVWGALKFVAVNKEGMVKDQIEIFRRGFLDLPQALIPQYILDETPYDQFNDLTIKEFPAAYIIPAAGTSQLSTHQPARLVDFLLFNDVQVEKTTQSFIYNGIGYPKGTYIVWMDQPKRGMANAILEDGPDVSDIAGIAFYSAPTAWSHPLLWGVTRARMEEKQSIKTSAINKADSPSGSVDNQKADYYAYSPTSLAAFKAANDLLNKGVTLYRAKSSGTFILPSNKGIANELANHWALDVFLLNELPDDAVKMKKQRIAVYGDEGVAIALDELGFEYDQVSTDELNAGAIAEYDLFINRNKGWSGLDATGQASFNAYFDAGGDYIGLLGTWTGFAGATFAVDAGIIDIAFDINWDADAILNIVYDPTDTIAAGFRKNGYGYTLNAVWFTDYPNDANVSASISHGNFLAAGFWPGWQTSPASGEPVIIHTEAAANGIKDIQDIVLIGLDSTFRGHPKNTFRLVGNAIFSGLD